MVQGERGGMRPQSARSMNASHTQQAVRPWSASQEQRVQDRFRSEPSPRRLFDRAGVPSPPLIWSPSDGDQTDTTSPVKPDAAAQKTFQPEPPDRSFSKSVNPRLWTWEQEHVKDFRSDDCYHRLVRRYGRSHGALGNQADGEAGRKSDLRANVHCPACLLEEQGTRRELEWARRELEREKAKCRAALKKQAEDYEAKLRAEQMLREQQRAEIETRDAEIPALKDELAALRQQLLEVQAQCEDLQKRLSKAEERERAAIEGQRRLLEQLELANMINRAAIEESKKQAKQSFDAAQVLEILKDFLRSGDAHRREYILQGLFGMYDTKQCHAILSSVLRYIGSQLNVSLFEDPAEPVNSFQIDHLLQWLLRLSHWSPEAITRGLSSEDEEIVCALLVALLKLLKAMKGSSTASVLEKLLSEADIPLASFGLSRHVQVHTVTTASQTEEAQEETKETEHVQTTPRRQPKQKRAKPMPIRVARRAIAKVYEKKALADFVDDRDGHRRDEMPEFIAEYFVHEYGFASLANKECAKLTASVLRYAAPLGITSKEDANIGLISTGAERYDRRLRLFGHLCGMIDKHASLENHQVGYHPSDGNIIMDLLAALYGRDLYDNNSVITAAALHHLSEKYGVEQPALPLSKCKAAVKAVWAARKITVPLELSQMILSMTVSKRGGQLEDMVDVDGLLELVWIHWSARRIPPMAQLYSLFSEFDSDQNGVLNCDEFSKLVKSLTSKEGVQQPSERELNRMYREAVEDTLESTGATAAEDAISVSMFVAVVQRHKLVNICTDPGTNDDDDKRSVTTVFGSGKTWKLSQGSTDVKHGVIRRFKRGSSMHGEGLKVQDIRRRAVALQDMAHHSSAKSPAAVDTQATLVPAS